MAANVFRQFGLLVWKNFRLQQRRKCCTCCEFVAPLLFTLLLVYMRGIAEQSDPQGPYIFDAFPLIGAVSGLGFEGPNGGIERLQHGMLFYTPINPTTEDLMARFIRNFNEQTTTVQGLSEVLVCKSAAIKDTTQRVQVPRPPSNLKSHVLHGRHQEIFQGGA